jgi:nucleoside-diphosphate-sugar epimerase
MFASIARAEGELGYEHRVSLEEGMRGSLRWMVEQDLLRSEAPL